MNKNTELIKKALAINVRKGTQRIMIRRGDDRGIVWYDTVLKTKKTVWYDPNDTE